MNCFMAFSLCCGHFVVLWKFRCVVHYWATVPYPSEEGQNKMLA